MLVPIPGQLVPSAPAPVPAGITYVNMGNNNGQQDGSGRTDEQFYSFDDFQQVRQTLGAMFITVLGQFWGMHHGIFVAIAVVCVANAFCNL